MLCGLSPMIINEIAGRGLAFWNYQVSQEIMYSRMVDKSLREVNSKLERQTQAIVHEAQQTIDAMEEKLRISANDRETFKRQAVDISEQLNEKGRQFHKLQSMYDKLKHKMFMSQEVAASQKHHQFPHTPKDSPQQQQQLTQGSMMHSESFVRNTHDARVPTPRPQINRQQPLFGTGPRIINMNQSAPHRFHLNSSMVQNNNSAFSLVQQQQSSRRRQSLQSVTNSSSG